MSMEDEVERDAREAEDFTLSLPVGERVEAAEEYEAARDVLTRLGRRLVSWWGGALSEAAVQRAVFVATAAFLEFLDRAHRYVEEGVEEGEALVSAFEELFTPSFAAAALYRVAVAERLRQDLPEDVLFGEAREGEEEGEKE